MTKKKRSAASHYTPKEEAERSRLAQEAGRRGGKARAARLSAERRSEIARIANAARYAKSRAKKEWVLDYVRSRLEGKELTEEQFNEL